MDVSYNFDVNRCKFNKYKGAAVQYTSFHRLQFQFSLQFIIAANLIHAVIVTLVN